MPTSKPTLYQGLYCPHKMIAVLVMSLKWLIIYHASAQIKNVEISTAFYISLVTIS